MIKTVLQALAFLTLMGDIFIIISLILLIFAKLKIFKGLAFYHKYLGPRALYLTFGVSLFATLGSLFFSEVAKFAPCALCWYQRIFMYPQPILLYLAILRDEKFIKPYLIVLNLIGAAVALYQYYIQVFPKSFLANCEAAGGVSCIKGYTFYFGYISIPFMALTAFAMNIIFLSLIKSKK